MFRFLSKVFGSNKSKEMPVSRLYQPRLSAEDRIEIEVSKKVLAECDALIQRIEKHIQDIPQKVLEMGKKDAEIQAMIDSIEFAIKCLSGKDEGKVKKALIVLGDYHEFDHVRILPRLEELAFSKMDLETRCIAMTWATGIIIIEQPTRRRTFAKKLHDIVFSYESSPEEKLIAYRSLCKYGPTSQIAFNTIDPNLKPEQIDYSYVAYWEKLVDTFEEKERQAGKR